MVKAPLELESRRTLYERAVETPGLHLRELARRAGMDVRTALHHLEHLERHGLVTAAEDGAFRRFFPRRAESPHEVVDARDRPLVGLLRRRVPLVVALVLLTRGPTGHGGILKEAGVAASTLSYHLRKMETAGVVRREGERYGLREPERVARLLYAYRPPADMVDGFLALWEDFAI